MTAATTTRAEFLKSAERSETAVSATLLARWGDAAGDTAQSSALIDKADATAEAARQLALFGNVMAIDQVSIEGVYFDLEGQVVRVDYTIPNPAGVFPAGTWFGGGATVDILVTKARPSLAEGFTLIEGLIRL